MQFGSRALGFLATAALSIGLGAGLSHGAVAVTGYNWLQLPPEYNITTAFGNTAKPVYTTAPDIVAGTGYGDKSEFRWGNHVWIPSGSLTSDGASDYWAILKLDQARDVSKVGVQLWMADFNAANQSNVSVTRFYVDGSTDNGANWTQIGVQTYGSAQSNQARTGPIGASSLNVTPGTYTDLRVRFAAGDYTNLRTSGGVNSSARGGPGIYAIEPLGSGSISDFAVNWANKPNFGTTASVNGFASFNSTRYIDGYLYDDEGSRTGNNPGNWDNGDYAQVNFGATGPTATTRLVNRVILVWDNGGWSGTDWSVQYSLDGTNFFNVAGLSATTTLNGNLGGASIGANMKTFTPVYAKAFRITNVTGSEQYHLLNQVLLIGFVPEPASMGTLLLGAGTMLMRRRRIGR